MNTVYDVIIVGTGAAGLFCALNFPETKKVCIITKRRADESDSFLAQGGICMLRGEEDYEDYFEDTMRAGHYENNKKTVDLMIRSSNLVIRELDLREMRAESLPSLRRELTASQEYCSTRTLPARRLHPLCWSVQRKNPISRYMSIRLCSTSSAMTMPVVEWL